MIVLLVLCGSADVTETEDTELNINDSYTGQHHIVEDEEGNIHAQQDDVNVSVDVTSLAAEAGDAYIDEEEEDETQTGEDVSADNSQYSLPDGATQVCAIALFLSWSILGLDWLNMGLINRSFTWCKLWPS